MQALRRVGYESAFNSVAGEFRNGWGIATLCRKTRPQLAALQAGLPGQEDRGARFLTVRSEDIEFSSVYAPYGNPRQRGFDGALDRELAWMKLLLEHLERRAKHSGQSILAGDFNVVSDGKSLSRTLNYARAERAALGRVPDLGSIDLYRRCHPDGVGGYNYEFDIRKPVSSRLHRILGTDAVAGRLRVAWVDMQYRQPIKEFPGFVWPQSAPVVVDLR